MGPRQSEAWLSGGLHPFTILPPIFFEIFSSPAGVALAQRISLFFLRISVFFDDFHVFVSIFCVCSLISYVFSVYFSVFSIRVAIATLIDVDVVGPILVNFRLGWLP